MRLSGEDMGKLFQNFQRSAFRMETQPTYDIPEELADLARWRAGRPKAADHNAEWCELVRANTEAGKNMQRLKVVRKPFSEYTRFLFDWAIPGNVEAGEDYRILDLSKSGLEVPRQDFWLFDDETVALLNFNDDGAFAGAAKADPAELDHYRKWRDAALAEAVPFSDYQP